MDKKTYENRIRIALREVPIGEKFLDGVIKNMPSKISDTLSYDSSFFDFKNKVEQTAKLVGVSKAQFVTAALKQPPLFCQSPDTLNKNIEQTAELMGVSKAQFVTAALKQPPLFYQSPDTLNKNIEQTAKLVGVSKAQFVNAALKQPQLFCQSPDTLNRNVSYIYDAAQKGYISSNNIIEEMLKGPALFCLSPKNTHLRAVDAHILKKPKALSRFFSGSNKKETEKRVVEHYSDLLNRTGKGLRPLQILAEMGIISKLPDDMLASEKPLRQRDRKNISPRFT